MSEREKLQATSSATGDLKTTPLPDEKLIQSLRNIDRKTIMHPFTPLSRWEQDSFPIITGASGSYLIDEKGNRFLDGTASLWVNLLGHKNPAIDQAIRDQLEQWGSIRPMR